MNQEDIPIFRKLMDRVLLKGTGKPLSKLSIGESQDLAFAIEEQLNNQTIGAKSLKNYTHYLIDGAFDRINPHQNTLNSLVQFLWETDQADGLWHEFRRRYKPQKKTIIPIPNSRTIVKGLAFLIALLVLSLIHLKQQKDLETYNYRFSNSSLPGLEEDGWFLFPDSIALGLWGNPKYRDDPYLTLETYPGDSFLDNPDYKPFVRNILARKISCGSCCKIQVKLIDFNPRQRYQQAGFFLFYNKETIPSIRFTAADGGTTIIKRDATYSNQYLIQNESHRKRARLYKTPNGKMRSQLDSVILEMRIKGQQYSFGHKINDEDLLTIRSQALPFDDPKYIGLAAFQGRPEIPAPVYPQADTIAAHFEYIRILPCEKN